METSSPHRTENLPILDQFAKFPRRHESAPHFRSVSRGRCRRFTTPEVANLRHLEVGGAGEGEWVGSRADSGGSYRQIARNSDFDPGRRFGSELSAPCAQSGLSRKGQASPSTSTGSA